MPLIGTPLFPLPEVTFPLDIRYCISFVVFAAGWGSLVLGLFYLLIDVKGWRAWAFPLVVAGINAIFICVVPILVKLHTLREWSWPVAAGPSLTLEQGLQNSLFLHLGRVPGGVLYTLCCILFWWLVLLWMYRRKVFLRVRRRLGGRWELRLRRFGC